MTSYECAMSATPKGRHRSGDSRSPLLARVGKTMLGTGVALVLGAIVTGTALMRDGDGRAQVGLTDIEADDPGLAGAEGADHSSSIDLSRLPGSQEPYTTATGEALRSSTGAAREPAARPAGPSGDGSSAPATKNPPKSRMDNEPRKPPLEPLPAPDGDTDTGRSDGGQSAGPAEPESDTGWNQGRDWGVGWDEDGPEEDDEEDDEEEDEDDD
jgi:hypothetical protein